MSTPHANVRRLTTHDSLLTTHYCLLPTHPAREDIRRLLGGRRQLRLILVCAALCAAVCAAAQGFGRVEAVCSVGGAGRLGRVRLRVRVRVKGER